MALTFYLLGLVFFFFTNWVSVEWNILWTKISLNTHQKARLLSQFSIESTNYAIFVRFPVNCRVQQNLSVWIFACCKCSLNKFFASLVFSRCSSVLVRNACFPTQTYKIIVQKIFLKINYKSLRKHIYKHIYKHEYKFMIISANRCFFTYS